MTITTTLECTGDGINTVTKHTSGKNDCTRNTALGELNMSESGVNVSIKFIADESSITTTETNTGPANQRGQ